MTVHTIVLKGETYHEDYYRLESRDLLAAAAYVGEIVGELRAAGVPDTHVTVRAELDAAPYAVEIEVYATPAQAATLGWALPAPDEV
jgi:hypothetical protein